MYSTYKTDQLFTTTDEVITGDQIIDMRATYTALSPYYTNAIEYRNKLREKLAKLDGKDTEDPDAQRPDFLGSNASNIIKLAACLVLIVALGRYIVVRPDNSIAYQEDVSQLQKTKKTLLGSEPEQIESDYFQETTKDVTRVIV